LSSTPHNVINKPDKREWQWRKRESNPVVRTDKNKNCFVMKISFLIKMLKTLSTQPGALSDAAVLPLSRATRLLSTREMHRLFATQPWLKMETCREGRYQHAFCEKG
jgi:hypothetical protein